MPSPFPGMNPYLEQDAVWKDFHDSLIPALRDALSPQVSPSYIVKIEEHIYIHEPSAEQRLLLGHGAITLSRGPASTALSAPSATTTAPARIVLPSIDIEEQPYLEVRDRQSGELITVIELLSPTNKRPGPDREQYLAKRSSLLRSGAHFVEIDLLRGFPRLPLNKAPACDYYVMVSRVEERPEAALWPIALRGPIPDIPIPLREPHPHAILPLMATLHGVCDRAYYKDYIYQGTPNPPLAPADAAWAEEQVRQSRGS